MGSIKQRLDRLEADPERYIETSVVRDAAGGFLAILEPVLERYGVPDSVTFAMEGPCDAWIAAVLTGKPKVLTVRAALALMQAYLRVVCDEVRRLWAPAYGDFEMCWAEYHTTIEALREERGIQQWPTDWNND